jgi:hypothetical protein
VRKRPLCPGVVYLTPGPRLHVLCGKAASRATGLFPRHANVVLSGLAMRWSSPEERERMENNNRESLREQGVEALIDSARTFCRRVEDGEVRSLRTYQEMKNALALIDGKAEPEGPPYEPKPRAALVFTGPCTCGHNKGWHTKLEGPCMMAQCECQAFTAGEPSPASPSSPRG